MRPLITCCFTLKANRSEEVHMKFEGKNYRVDLLSTDGGLAIVGGFFGEVQIAYGELFKLRLKHAETGEVINLTSLEGWKA